GARLAQRLRSAAAIDADDEPEPAGTTRGDAGERVLDDDGAPGLRAETACGLEEHVRCGLAGETRALEVDAVDPDIEEPRNARRLEHRRAISARRDDGRLDVVIAQGLGKGDRARERIDTVPRELLGEVTVL